MDWRKQVPELCKGLDAASYCTSRKVNVQTRDGLPVVNMRSKSIVGEKGGTAKSEKSLDRENEKGNDKSERKKEELVQLWFPVMTILIEHGPDGKGLIGMRRRFDRCNIREQQCLFVSSGHEKWLNVSSERMIKGRIKSVKIRWTCVCVCACVCVSPGMRPRQDATGSNKVDKRIVLLQSSAYLFRRMKERKGLRVLVQ